MRGANSRRFFIAPTIIAVVENILIANKPKVVAIGGGHGLAALLRGIKHETPHITAIVTVADDGGSSGRLRRDMGTLPPGDFRMCITALARDDSLVAQLFQYRFSQGDGLKGHNFGNLFIAAMAELTGSFERALIEASKVLASTGRILPSTLTHVNLCAEHSNGATSKGESALGKLGHPIERVWLEPHDPRAFPDAVAAILAADIVLMGPGSLFTSVMPNLLVPGIHEAVHHTTAQRVYVCNVTTEIGETDGYSLADHVQALERHIGKNMLDVVIANNAEIDPILIPAGRAIIRAHGGLGGTTARLVTADLVGDIDHPIAHHPQKLARAILTLGGRPTTI